MKPVALPFAALIFFVARLSAGLLYPQIPRQYLCSDRNLSGPDGIAWAVCQVVAPDWLTAGLPDAGNEHEQGEPGLSELDEEASFAFIGAFSNGYPS